MTEDYSNGIDDDCDGAIDGGSLTVYSDVEVGKRSRRLLQLRLILRAC